ncbi:tRNA (adenosine(37)-N6)-threonylcarbamoyltransferase complex dimerization subunit type 1 TsaB [Psychrosphaera aestuarii]|uniref:tRNA (adenosine(37)-N6)-threonylcarbamoyltransferase complex dimerization subunit type 1 TsaB n=1 Tax=Psychrosphaera aestuarii TaxID=1266052 RepID=UPI001B3378ED|nr:tRNA (adenosine(37)-N6)-threonylcarbamoyltransferase complex dimerization subunit type 1 TsaB [Psychrosphaera aestuarii]
MKLLALDAATEACSVAIKLDERIFSYFEVCPQQHSQKLLPGVETLLKESKLSLEQFDGILYGCGPGSFTGVRIGVSITQGLAFGADLPVLGVSNLALMAQQAIEEHGAEQVIAAIDARMSEVYFAIYNNIDGVAVATLADMVCKPESIDLSDFKLSDNAIAVGTGWGTYQEILSSKVKCEISNITLPDVKFGFTLVEDKFKNGEGLPAELAQPNYVRDEVTWKKLPGR